MKTRKFSIIKLAIVILLICPILFFSGWFVLQRFCWRGFDYYFCGDPTVEISYAIRKFDDKSITLIAYARSWSTRYDGFDYYVKDNTLYFAIKTVILGGESFGAPATFNIETDKSFDKVIVKGRGAEKVFYPDDVI